MATWTYNPNEYTARNFEIIPEGDHRVRISNVQEKVFSTGNEGFEITLDVPGHAGKLWYYLVLDHRDPMKTNQRIGMFFDSFAIQSTNLNHCSDWIGRDGAVRVKHNLYNGAISASVAFCLSRSQQKKFIDFGADTNRQSGRSFQSNSSHQKRFNGFDSMPATHSEFPGDFKF